MIQRTPKWSAVPLYYRANYSTYLKLRAIRKMYYRTLSAYGSWKRWNRKLYTMSPEPDVCPAFVNTGYYAHEIASELKSWHIWLEDIFELARMPSVEPVQEFTDNTLDQINHYYSLIIPWLPDNENPYIQKFKPQN